MRALHYPFQPYPPHIVCDLDPTQYSICNQDGSNNMSTIPAIGFRALTHTPTLLLVNE